MNDFTPQPIVIREVNGLVIAQSGDAATVNGRPAPITASQTIRENPRHWLRAVLAKVLPKIESGEIAAVVHAEIGGKPGYITITAEQFAAGASERARYEGWLADVLADKADLTAKERAYDLANNEGGEGYNPWRATSERTYARNRNVDRDYPEGA